MEQARQVTPCFCIFVFLEIEFCGRHSCSFKKASQLAKEAIPSKPITNVTDVENRNDARKNERKNKTYLQHPCPNHVSGRYYSQGNPPTLSHASRERKRKN